MNNREAAIAALLRQGWVATSRPAAAANVPMPTSTPTSPQERQPQQQPLIELPETPENECTAEPSTSTQTEAETTPSRPDVVDVTLIDLSDETILVDTTTAEVPSPDSSATSSSRESLASLMPSTSSGESVEYPEPEKPQEGEKEQGTENEENEPDVDADTANTDDAGDLFTPIPPFTMPVFSSTASLAARPVIPPSLHDWILCSEVGLQFMRPARENVVSCVACGQDCEDGAGSDGAERVFRSMFWRMTTCRASHRPDVNANNSPSGLCKRCDKDYVLQVVRGEHRCRHEGCRRVLRVHLRDVEDALWDHPGLYAAFHTLVQKESAYECAIHSDVVTDTGDQTDLTSDCDHDRNACKPCLTQFCEAAIQGDRVNDLVCPEPACRQPLAREAVRDLVSADCLRLYDKKLAFAAMARNPNFRWCRCGHGQIHAAGDAQPEWTCTACTARHCFVCQDQEEGDICNHLRRIDNERALRRLRDEHERSRGVSEDMVRQRQLAQRAAQHLATQARENIRGTQVMIASTAKRCPRLGCRVPIQRDAGCGHMVCRRCATEFCWACKVIWKAPTRTGPGSVFGGTSGGGGPSATILTPLHLPTCPLAAQRTIARRRLNLAQYATGWDVDHGYDQELDNDLWLQADQQ